MISLFTSCYCNVCIILAIPHLFKLILDINKWEHQLCIKRPERKDACTFCPCHRNLFLWLHHVLSPGFSLNLQKIRRKENTLTPQRPQLKKKSICSCVQGCILRKKSTAFPMLVRTHPKGWSSPPDIFKNFYTEPMRFRTESML